MSEQYVPKSDLAHVTEAMGVIQETALRMDERVKVLLERQAKSEIHLHEIRETINSLVSRVSVLESKNESDLKITVEKSRDRIFEIEKQIHTLILKESTHDNRWKVIFDWVGKILWVATAAYLLYRLGYNPPPIS
jgi:hypothetical protein